MARSQPKDDRDGASPDALRVQCEIYRQMPPDRKIEMVFESYRTGQLQTSIRDQASLLLGMEAKSQQNRHRSDQQRSLGHCVTLIYRGCQSKASDTGRALKKKP